MTIKFTSFIVLLFVLCIIFSEMNKGVENIFFYPLTCPTVNHQYYPDNLSQIIPWQLKARKASLLKN